MALHGEDQTEDKPADKAGDATKCARSNNSLFKQNKTRFFHLSDGVISYRANKTATERKGAIYLKEAIVEKLSMTKLLIRPEYNINEKEKESNSNSEIVMKSKQELQMSFKTEKDCSAWFDAINEHIEYEEYKKKKNTGEKPINFEVLKVEYKKTVKASILGATKSIEEIEKDVQYFSIIDAKNNDLKMLEPGSKEFKKLEADAKAAASRKLSKLKDASSQLKIASDSFIEQYKGEISNRISKSTIIDCHEAVDAFKQKYKDKCLLAWSRILRSEGDDVVAYIKLVDHIEDKIKSTNTKLMQDEDDRVALYLHAAFIKGNVFDKFLKELEKTVNLFLTEKEENDKLKELKDMEMKLELLDLKKMGDIVEKCLWKYNEVNARAVCDIVRGRFSCKMKQINQLLHLLLDREDIEIVGVKDNFVQTSTVVGLRNCYVYFYFRKDSAKHICKIELIHEKFHELIISEDYEKYRTASQLLRKKFATKKLTIKGLKDIKGKLDGVKNAAEALYLHFEPEEKNEDLVRFFREEQSNDKVFSDKVFNFLLGNLKNGEINVRRQAASAVKLLNVKETEEFVNGGGISLLVNLMNDEMEKAHLNESLSEEKDGGDETGGSNKDATDEPGDNASETEDKNPQDKKVDTKNIKLTAIEVLLDLTKDKDKYVNLIAKEVFMYKALINLMKNGISQYNLDEVVPPEPIFKDLSVNAATIIGNLSVNDTNRGLIGKAGVIPPLVKLVERGEKDQSEVAGKALRNLTQFNARNSLEIVKADGIKPLVALLHGTGNQKDIANETLWNMVENTDIKEEILNHGVVNMLFKSEIKRK